ncbi:MAG: sterol desaturase family protein [Gammaproteobacteria bacterium]|nr:sterol desaturase family protein [Gammaproteobacteria bacterium]
MESIDRLPIFVAVLLVMIIWELIVPRRHMRESRWQRWTANFALSVLSMIIMRFTIASAAVWVASMAVDNHWGLLNVVNLPYAVEFFVSIVLLDLAIYWQHRASHQWSWLWRLHKVHHTDLDFDVTTAIRFHPIEIFLSMCYKVICILMIGSDPVSVIVFEIILSSCALFNHSNIKLPLAIDRVVRLFLVTPDMHRVHHSVNKFETNSNYCFSISIWDRLFNSYVAQPQQGHLNMKIGLAEYQHIEDVSIPRLLLMPFKRVL